MSTGRVLARRSDGAGATAPGRSTGGADEWSNFVRGATDAPTARHRQDASAARRHFVLVLEGLALTIGMRANAQLGNHKAVAAFLVVPVARCSVQGTRPEHYEIVPAANAGARRS